MKIKKKSFRGYYAFIIVFLVLYLGFYLIKTSVVLKAGDRLNLVFYGQDTSVYSIGTNDVSYKLLFPAEIYLSVPGGYGYYRTGSIGKLVSLEKKPDLYKRVFSAASSSFIDLYFYPQIPTIYYGKEEAFNKRLDLADILINKSNANLLDRLYLVWRLVLSGNNQYRTIDDLPIKQGLNRKLFDREAFKKQSQGYFYKRTYRTIRENVQILYTKNYKTAKILSDVIEGEGIRVVDLTQTDHKNECRLSYQKTAKSLVTENLANFFKCRMEKKATELSDIILELGKLEEEWETE
ncbi:MAG: hypothetical protein US11_C0008G0012 [Candidatus Roizmanbacteria bacterium GW2011_GWA2_36_23]|uniref:Uncharacterized protein n=1 Tax=Candidatus Roizmanbacteria bacterium GW2011_GWA2_36_23 TaxID=1618480 RepID=A0A0G0EK41_9BACT|nr:MAG: hypothetical protein US11_C0008G0012 [Candidatus Roizmanbacteria bacterium GW2011_GWA2_36_23]